MLSGFEIIRICCILQFSSAEADSESSDQSVDAQAELGLCCQYFATRALVS